MLLICRVGERILITVGADSAGGDVVHRDPVRGELDCHVQRNIAQCGLARSVHQHRFERLHLLNAADGDDASPMLALHVRHEALEQHYRRTEVEIHMQVKLLICYLLELQPVLDRGVEDEDIHREPHAGDLFVKLVRAAVLGKVLIHDAVIRAHRLKCGNGLIGGSGGSAAVHYHACALLRHREQCGSAYAAAGAGNENGFPMQIEHIYCSFKTKFMPLFSAMRADMSMFFTMCKTVSAQRENRLSSRYGRWRTHGSTGRCFPTCREYRD